jgi:pimeloyl-ACP methyl ester carboxylesterase
MAIHLKLSTIQTGAAAPVTQEEMDHAALIRGRGDAESGYSHLQSTRPQTLGFGLHDSPVGTAAWILEKFAAWSDLPREAGVPDLEAVYSLDQLLTNVMVYLVGGSMVTSTWIYQGATIEKSRLLERRVEVPTAVAAFADPVFPAPPRSLAEQSFNVVRWTKMTRGGHFPALEQPEMFASDVRAFALTLAGNA